MVVIAENHIPGFVFRDEGVGYRVWCLVFGMRSLVLGFRVLGGKPRPLSFEDRVFGRNRNTVVIGLCVRSRATLIRSGGTQGPEQTVPLE